MALLALAAAGCGGGEVKPTPTPSPKPTWGTAERIGGGTDAERSGVAGWVVPRLAMNASGAAFVAWGGSTAVSDAGSDIWVNRYDPSRGWGVAEVVGNGKKHALVVDAAGNALLVWGADGVGSSSLQWRRFTLASGWRAAAPVPIASTTTVSFSLATTPAGDALLVWASGSELWASGLSAAGVWGAAVRIAVSSADPYPLGPGSVSSPQVVLDASGNAAVIWFDFPATWPVFEGKLRGTHFVSGSGWREARTFGSSYDFRTTRLDGDLAGNALIGWFTRTRGLLSPGPPMLTRLSVAAGWQDGEEIPALPPVWGQEQMAVGPNGTAVVIVNRLVTPGVGHGPAAMRLAPTTSWSGPVEITIDASQYVGTADLGVGSDGNALVVWDQHGAATTTGSVWAAEVSAGPQWGTATPLHGAALASTCSPDFPPGIGASPAVRLDSSGRAVAVWAEYDCVRWSVWSNARLPR